MAIRRRITSLGPVRNNTGLHVLALLERNGVERTLAQRCIGHVVTKLWSLNAAPRGIVAAELDREHSTLVVMTSDATIHNLNVSDIL